ncbi:MAG: amino acid permease, partial [Erysipelotrichales bacterium]
MELKKTLGLSVALSTVISSLIGSGVFFKPQIVYELTGGAPGLGMLAWLVAGLITITAGLTVAELAAIIPKTGGMMVYIKEIYGEKLGFLTGWMQILLFYPGMIAALGVIFADQLTQLIGMPQFLLPISIGIIFIIAALNLLSTKTGGMIQNAATICKLIPIALIIVAGFVVGSGDNPIISPMVGKDVNVSSVIGHVLISVLFAYDGWLNVTTIAGEMKNPGKDLPRAIIGGISIVTAIFLLINLAYLWVLPASELAVNTSPATAVANVIFGPKGGTIIAVGILISIFGTLNSYTLSGSRVVYKLAIDKTLPMHDKLSKLSDSQVPANAIVLIAFVSSIYAISGQYNLLTDLAIFSSWVFYILTFIGVFKLRKSKPDIQRDYKVPLYPVVPILAILSGLYVIF